MAQTSEIIFSVLIGLLIIGLLIFFTATSFGKSKLDPHTKGHLNKAVTSRLKDEVKRLLDLGADPNDADHRGQQALILATTTDQYEIVNILLDHGADLCFTDRLGFTAAIFAETSRLRPESEEGKHRSRAISRMKQMGYPWPPPNPKEVVKMREQGKWPPNGVKCSSSAKG